MGKSQERLLKEKIIEPLKTLKERILSIISDREDRADVIIEDIKEAIEDPYIGDVIVNYDEEKSNKSLEIVMTIGKPSGECYHRAYASIQINSDNKVGAFLKSLGKSIDINKLEINQSNRFELSVCGGDCDDKLTITLDANDIEVAHRCILDMHRVIDNKIEINKNTKMDKEELLRGYIVNPLKTIYDRIIRLNHKNKSEKVKSKIIDLISKPEFHWVEREIAHYDDGNDMFIRVPIGTMYEDPEKEVSFCISISPKGIVTCDINYYDKFIDIYVLRIHQNKNGFIVMWDAYEDFQEVCNINEDMVNRAYKLILGISAELNTIVPRIKQNELGRLNKAINEFIAIKDTMNKKPSLICSTEFFDNVFKWISSRNNISDINYDRYGMNISLTIRYQNKIIHSYERVIIKLKYNKNKGIVESIIDNGEEHVIAKLESVVSCDYERGAMNIMTFLEDNEQCSGTIVIPTEISRDDLFSLEGQVKSIKAFVNKQINMENNQEYKAKITAVGTLKVNKPTEVPFDKTKALKGIVEAMVEIRDSLKSLAEENYLRKAEEMMTIINNSEEASGLISSDGDHILSVMLEYRHNKPIEVTLEHTSCNNCELYIHVRDEYHTHLNGFKEIYDIYGTSMMMVCVDNYHRFGITISKKQLELLLNELSTIVNKFQEL